MTAVRWGRITPGPQDDATAPTHRWHRLTSHPTLTNQRAVCGVTIRGRLDTQDTGPTRGAICPACLVTK